MAARYRFRRRLIEPQRRVRVAHAAAMAKNHPIEISGEITVEHVRRLTVGGVYPLPSEQLDQDRANGRKIEEADNLKRERLAARVEVHPRTVFLPTKLSQKFGALPGVELIRRILFQQRLGGVKIGLEALVNGPVRHRQRRQAGRSAPADVDQGLPVDKIAHRPTE